jgi:NAD(P)-dependent dehydrogenase (short-subunit alcohol dehydrogenase family)
MKGTDMMRRLVLLSLSTAICAAAGIPAGAAENPWQDKTVLVTGANRGLGLEFARQLQAAGATVIGTARNPATADELKTLGVRVEQLDVTDTASVAALAERLEGMALDVLLNNAGIFPNRSTFDGEDPAEALRVYDVNTVGPLRVTQALLPNLRTGGRKLVMNMSSGLGSIADNGRGSSAAYRASKAALNMLTRTMAMDLADEGFIFVAMSPGWARTDMGGEQANLSPEESVRGMLAVLAPLTTRDTGKFLSYDGNELPW